MTQTLSKPDNTASSNNSLYNVQAAHEADLVWEQSLNRREIKFLGVPLYVFRRGQNIKSKANERKYHVNLKKLGVRSFIYTLRSNRDCYIGFDRKSVLDAVANQGVKDDNILLVEELDSHSKPMGNYNHFPVALRLVFIALTLMLFLPKIILTMKSYESTFRKTLIVHADILYSKLLVAIANKRKKIYFWGGIPYAVAFIKESPFIEVQHGIVHKYYPALADMDARQTPMLLWIPGDYDFFQKKNIIFANGKNIYGEPAKLKKGQLVFCGTTDYIINLKLIMHLTEVGIKINKIKKHPRDDHIYKNLLECNFDEVLTCENVYMAPSSIINELLLNQYQGEIFVMNEGIYDKSIFETQFLELYLPMKNFMPKNIAFIHCAC